ncbi:MAG: hypothetical protein ABL930_10400, partial [Pseudobdellovibrio sp.]
SKVSEFRLLQNKIFMSLFLLLSIIAIAYVPAKANHVPHSVGILALICGLVVLIASFDRAYLFRNKAVIKLLTWFGSRSYSLYLAHIIIFRLSYEIFYQLSPLGYRMMTDDWYYLLAISIPLLVVASEISYHYIELPTRNYGLKLAAKINLND